MDVAPWLDTHENGEKWESAFACTVDGIVRAGWRTTAATISFPWRSNPGLGLTWPAFEHGSTADDGLKLQ